MRDLWSAAREPESHARAHAAPPANNVRPPSTQGPNLVFRFGSRCVLQQRRQAIRLAFAPQLSSGKMQVPSEFSERLGRYVRWTAPALEEKVAEWSSQLPMIWNAGIGPEASFLSTLSRLLFERTKELAGPYDHIMRVRLTIPATAAETRATQRLLAFEVLMEMARCVKIPLPEEKLQELRQFAAEEGYYGYNTASDNLLLEAFGWGYADRFEIDDTSMRLDPNNYRHSIVTSQMVKRIREALKGKRQLLLIENLHVPIQMNVLVFTMGTWPSIFHNRWLVSTTSKDVCDKSRKLVRTIGDLDLMPEYYRALPFDDLRKKDWAVLINEALRDAASSIHNILQQQRDVDFWFHVAQKCLYYAILYHPLQGSAGCQATGNTSSVSSDELVRCWVTEDLIFSMTGPTDIAAAGTGNKQSNCYSSAYEAGRVVIQALQQYSLLPTYSVSTPTSSTSWTASTSTSSSQDAITGVSKLSEDVARLKQDELSDPRKSWWLRWVSFMNDDGRHLSMNMREMKNWFTMPELLKYERKMSTLILRGCTNICFPFRKALSHHLCVLDLSYTAIDSLPNGISQLLNLRLLSLRGCFQLKALSPPPPAAEEENSPLACLGNLQVLDMNGVPLLQLTQQDGGNKRNLHYLDLSGLRISTLPSEFFSGMSCLEELILGNCSNLKELPPSMAALSNLLILHVEGIPITSFPEDMFQAMQRLHTLKLINNMMLLSLPRSVSEAKCLKEIHIYNCIGLRLQFLWELLPYLEDLYIQTWEALEDIKIHGHQNLRTFSISGPWIRCLSLLGCNKLKSVNFSDDLTRLEDVDLSGTALEEVPGSLLNLLKLRTLLLINVPFFKRFPWHQIIRFPRMFCLDHCRSEHNQCSKMFCMLEICGDENQHRGELTTNTAHIKINDSMMFHSFNKNAADKLVKEGQFLQSFHIQIKSCSARGKETQNKADDRIQRVSPYPDVHSDEAASIVPMVKLQPKQRHVEISSKNRYPVGLRHLLSVTNSMFITDDYFIKCLSDLNYSFISLEECQLQHCHQMAVLFRTHLHQPQVLPSLKILQATNLDNLRCFVEPDQSYLYLFDSLKLLKYIHLEKCPRLEKIFPCSLSLPTLETLIILFCSNLKTIFYKHPECKMTPSLLPNIKNIYFQELPQLQHFHDDVMFRFETPKWEKFFVRGCHSFQRLPLLKQKYPESKVEVNGERDWWGKLKWSRPEQSNYYLHVAPPGFVSQKKHIIRSYLR